MPRVPSYDNFQEQRNLFPQQGAEAPRQPIQSPIDPGVALTRASQGAMRTGKDLSRIAEEMAREVNQARLDDAVLQLREYSRLQQYGNPNDPNAGPGFQQLTGKDALERPNGQSLADEYGARIQERISQISASLGNEAQRAAFAHYSSNFLGGFKDNVWQHTFQQQRTYNNSVDDGFIADGIENIKLNYLDPAATQASVEQIKRHAYLKGHRNGLAANEIDAEVNKQVSNAHLTAINAFLNDQRPDLAKAYYDKYGRGKQMTMDDSLRIEDIIHKEFDSHTALQTVDSLMQSNKNPGPAELAFTKGVLPIEGGTNPDGSFRTSPKGALGPAQVMPGTAPEAAKLAGLKWDENLYKTDANYNKALGLAYFQKQYADFGNLPMAYAAYNAGPGAVKDAMKKGGANWLAQLPKETQAYVTNGVDRYNRAAARGPQPIDVNALDAQLRERVGDNPRALQLARQELDRRVKLHNAELKQQQELAFADVVQNLASGKTWNQLDPALRNSIPAEKVSSAISLSEKLNKGVTDWNTYAQLSAMASSDPKGFLQYDLRTAFPYLADTQRKQLVDLQAHMRDPNKRPDVVSLQAQLNTAHQQLGFLTTSEERGKFDDAVHTAIVAAQSEKGKRLTDMERQAIIKKMMLPVEVPGRLFGTNTRKYYQVFGTSGEEEAAQTAKPTDEEKKLIAVALAQEGIVANEENIMKRFRLRYGL